MPSIAARVAPGCSPRALMLGMTLERRPILYTPRQPTGPKDRRPGAAGSPGPGLAALRHADRRRLPALLLPLPRRLARLRARGQIARSPARDRRAILSAFEAAETEPNPGGRCSPSWSSGPADGVEIAGEIAELARSTLRGEFRSIESRQSRVLLIETADRVLTTFPPSLSRNASR